MGSYLNPSNDNFIRALNSEIYVDKTDLIRYTNKVINTQQQNICVSTGTPFWKIYGGKHAFSILQPGMPV